MTPETQPDTQALAALHAQCFQTPRPWTAREFAQLLDDPANFLITAPGGFLLGRQVLDEGELLTLAVDPALRRQGIARGLMQAFDARLQAQGAETAYLEVASDNSGAIALYLSAGFTLAGRRPRYYRAADGTRIDAEIMSKTTG